MLRLMLLRHATAVPQGSMPDFERVLSEQGEAEAQAMADYCQTEMLWPDLAIVSPAQRTQATHAAFLQAGTSHSRRIVSDLYSAQKDELFNIIREIEDNIKVLLYVGHNPACAELALALTGFGDRYAAQRMRFDFAPACLAVLDFDCQHWNEITWGMGRLDRFRSPQK